jgi:flagellar M-ring protein FliF
MISEIAQAAIGFNSDRGDVISVQNLAFDHPQADDLEPVTFFDRIRKGLTDYSTAIRYSALLTLFILIYMLVIRPVQKRVLATPLPALANTKARPLAEPEENPSLEATASLAQRSVVLKKQLADFVRNDPESSTTAVRAWLREEAP